MLRQICGLLLCSFLLQTAQACDVCGCAPVGNTLNFLPEFQKHFVGIRYQFQGFRSLPHEDHAHDLPTTERFNTLQAYGRLVIHQRLHLLAFVPYRINQRNTETDALHLNGLGDISFQLQYLILNNYGSGSTLQNALQLGAGLKLPSGKFDALDKGLMIHNNMQLGSGSVDFSANVIHTLRMKAWGLNTSCMYNRPGENVYQFRFGHQLNVNTRAFYLFTFKEMTLMPQLGCMYDLAGADYLKNESHTHTGGQQWSLHAGADCYFKSYALGFQATRAIKENLAEGHITSLTRFQFNLIYLLKHKPIFK
jgi:hypothetical protein